MERSVDGTRRARWGAVWVDLVDWEEIFARIDLESRELKEGWLKKSGKKTGIDLRVFKRGGGGRRK